MNKLLPVIVACLSWATTAAAQRLSIVVVDDKYGYIDSTGRVVIVPQFTAADPFHEGLARACMGTLGTPLRCGFIDTTGTMVISARYPDRGDDSRFAEGRANVEVDGKWGYLDRSGRLVIPAQFQRAGWFSERRAVVMMNNTFGYIDTIGSFVIPPRFSDAWDFSEGLAGVSTSKNEIGFIDTTGMTVIQRPKPRPNKWGIRVLGPMRFTQGRLPLRTGDTWGYIDRTGRLAIPDQFDEAESFSEGLARVRVRDQWGYIDTTGAMFIQPRFKKAGDFSDGLAAVEIDGKVGYIDAAGRIVIPPQYSVELHSPDFSNGLACVSTRVYTDVYPACQRLGVYIDRTGRTVWHATPAAVAQRPAAPPPDTTPLPGTGPFVDRVAAVVDRAEAAERGQPAANPEQIMADLTKAAAQLTAYLNSHPDDVRALILSVRLGRFSTVAEPVVTVGGRPVPTFATLAAAYAPHHSALNHALALEPNSAEVHYWKARLFGLSHDWMGMLYGVSDVPPGEDSLAHAYADSAIRYGRRAVELAPDRVPYREALAIYLILNDQEHDATTVLRAVAGGHHPMSDLLADWDSIPIPPGAVSLRGQAQGFARMELEGGAIPDYPFLRVRMYGVPGPADSVQAFYAKRWPGFHLVLMETQEHEDVRLRTFGQYLRWRNGRVILARGKRDISGQPTEGVTIVLLEVTNPPAEMRQTMRMPSGRVISSLTFLDLRRVDAH